MAAKYMGAKMLRKQIEKDAKVKETVRKKGTIHGNKGEYLDRKKQRFELTQSSMMGEADFEEEDDALDNPEFTRAYEALRRKEHFFLSMNEKFFEGNDQSDSEDENQKFNDMLKRANNETKTLYKGNDDKSDASFQGSRVDI